MAIAKDIIKQVEYTSGSASAGMLDGWQQLNKLMDNFKEILGQVGGIFSKVFGPVLSLFNSILEIPFIKSVTAWSIALGSVVVGYISIVNLLSKVIKSTKQNTKITKLTIDIKEKLKQFQEEYNSLINKQAQMEGQITQLLIRRTRLKEKLNEMGVSTGKEARKTPEGKEYQSLSSTISRQRKIIGETKLGLQELLDSIESLGKETLIAALGQNKFTDSFKGFIQQIDLGTIATKKSTLAIIKQTAAKIKSATISYAAKLTSTGADAVSIGSSITALLVSLWSKLKQGFVGFLDKIKALYNVLKPFFDAVGQILLRVGATVAKALATVLAIIGAFVIPFDLVTMALNKIQGKKVDSGTITKWFAELIFSADTSEMDKKLAERKARFENAKTEFNNIIKDYLNGLEVERFNRMIENMLPQNAIGALQKRNQQLQAEQKKYKELLAQQKKELQVAYAIDDEKDRNNAVATVKQKIQDTLSALTNNYNAQIDVVDKLKAKNNELIQSQIAYVNKVDQIQKKYRGVFETFNYGYKNGKFGNYTDDQKYNNLNTRSIELQRRLQSRNYRNLQQQESMTNELFEITKQMYQYQLQSLMKQREAAIQNLKGMNELVKQAYTFKSTAQSAVSADSTEAIVLQSRQRDGFDKKEFGPIIDQQKQIKEIEKKMLQRQTTGTNILNSIGQQLLKIANRMPGNTSTGSGIIVVAP